MAVQPIPEGLPTIVPYLCIRGAKEAIEFYRRAFGAEETLRIDSGDKIGHAEMRIGDSVIYIADEHPEQGFQSPQSIGGNPVMFMINVEDVDAFVKRATDAGAKITRPIENQFYGDRSGGISDPYGYNWMVSTHVEDVSEEELQRRAAEAFGG